MFDARGFLVGCGHAVAKHGTALRLVRLSDGRSWLLPSEGNFRWTYQVAVDCTHVYGMVNVANVTRTARVRIDSLGPGIAPD